MKKFANIFIIVSLVLSFIIFGCNIAEFDSYDEPNSILSGQVTFNGQPIGVKSPTVNASGTQTSGVLLELWQDGYELRERIPVYINYDGSFSAMLFDGNYKMVQAEGSPWAVNTDTVAVNVNGNTEINVGIDPFFVITNENFQRSGNSVIATFNVEQIDQNANLDYVGLYIGQTLITDNVRFQASQINSDPDLNTTITISVDMTSSILEQGYLFARVGVKESGVSELLFTQVQRIEL